MLKDNTQKNYNTQKIKLNFCKYVTFVKLGDTKSKDLQSVFQVQYSWGVQHRVIPVGHTKVEAFKSSLFIKVPLKSKEHLFDLVVTLYLFSLWFNALHSGERLFLGTFIRVFLKSCNICISWLKVILVAYEKHGTQSI